MAPNEIALLVLLILFLYPLVIYPLILLILPQKKHTKREKDIEEISILIAAYNEEEHIEECIYSILDSDRGELKIEILVGSDGSDDSTVKKVNQIDDSNVKAFNFDRGGKNATINKLVDKAKYDTLLFLDADFRLKNDSLIKIVDEFSGLDVGVIILPIEMKVNEETSTEGESVYQKYESFIRRKESNISSCVNTLGGYIIEKDTFEKISSDTYCDDLHSILSSIRKRKRVYFSEKNSILEVRESNFFEDFKRRKRLVGGGLSTIFAFKDLLSFEYGWNAFFLWSHKVLRWFSSVFFVFTFILSLTMLNSLFGLITAYIIAMLFILSFIGLVMEKNESKNPFKIPLFFVSMNIGFIIGIFQYFKGEQNAIWSRKGLD
ncbi:MAG: glycosyltransferase [Chlorobiota bacterium]